MPKGKGSKQGSDHAYGKLQTYDEQIGALRVVIEAPRGCQNKYKLNEHTGLFDLHKVLPTGMFFPLDFGYVPATLADDGDPIDVLMFTDNPTFTGCVARVRLLGVIKAEQRGVAEPDWKKNHRLLAVALVSHTHQHMQTIDDIDPEVLEEIEQFFVTYNKAQGKQFNLLGRGSKETAEQFVREAMARRVAVDAHSQNAMKKKPVVTRVIARTNVIPLAARANRISSISESEFEGEDGTASGVDDNFSDEPAVTPIRKRAKSKKKVSTGVKRSVKSKKAGPAKRAKKKATGVTKRAKAKKAGTAKRPKAGAKKTTAKKATAKKATAKKATSKKAGTKKRAVKKTTAKKVTAKKATAKKATAKKATSKRPAAKKSTAKKPAARKRALTKKTPSSKKAKAKPRAKKAGITKPKAKPKKGVKISKLAKSTAVKRKKTP